MKYVSILLFKIDLFSFNLNCPFNPFTGQVQIATDEVGQELLENNQKV